MCRAMGEWYQNALNKVEKKEDKLDVIRGLLWRRQSSGCRLQGRSEQEIAEETGISPEEVKEILR